MIYQLHTLGYQSNKKTLFLYQSKNKIFLLKKDEIFFSCYNLTWNIYKKKIN